MLRLVKRNNGFTLIELVVVIAILVLLTAIIVPTISNHTAKATDAAKMANAKMLVNTTKLVISDGTNLSGNYNATFDEEDGKYIIPSEFSDYIDEWPEGFQVQVNGGKVGVYYSDDGGTDYKWVSGYEF